MASRPQLHAMAKRIEELGGDSWVFDQITDGRPVKDIVAALDDGYTGRDRLDLTRPMLYQWRDMPPHEEERRAAWEVARKLSAYASLEDGQEILDDLASAKGALMPAEVSLASSRANYRMARAKISNPDLDPKRGAEVSISIGSLHLDSLRELGGGSRRRVEEAEVLAIESGEGEE